MVDNELIPLVLNFWDERILLKKFIDLNPFAEYQK